MKISLSGATLTSAVAQVSKITGAKHVSFQAVDDKLIISGSEKGRTLIVRIDAAVKEEGTFTVLPEVIIGVCRNRKEVSITKSSDDSQVTLKSGKYSADISILPHEEITLEEPEGTELDMEDAELRVILDACNKAQLTAPYVEGAPSLPLHVNITTKGTHVASLDQFHVASVRTKQVTQDEELDVVLPSGVLASVSSASDGEKYRIILSEALVYATNDSFQLALPVDQPEGNNLSLKNVQMMQNIIKKTEEVTTVSVNFPQLDAILNNIYAVAESGVPIIFKIKKNTLTIGTTTNYGSASDTIDAEVSGEEGEFSFNPTLIGEIFGKVNTDTLEINFLPKFLYLAQRNGETTSLFIVLRYAA